MASRTTLPTPKSAKPVPDVLAPAKLGPITLRNRVIKSATFEGMTPDDLVTDALIEFHSQVGRGGVGMTTVAYCAVAPEGRTQGGQLYWRPEVLPGMQRLTDAVHATGAKISAQLGHAGPVANSRSTGYPSISASRRFNALAMGFDKKATKDDIQRIIKANAAAAAMARDTGFDAVEVHFGHNYLVGSFLSPLLNKRKDEFGGSLANRAEFGRRILAAIREEVGDDLAVLVKMNMADGVKGGFWLDESIPFAQMLEADGNIHGIELTGGSSLLDMMYLFRGDVPVNELADSQTPLLRMGIKMFGSLYFKKYPYEPMYFLDYARQFRAAVKLPLIALGGYTDKTSLDTAMAEGFDFVAMGRALLREPDLVNKIAADHSTKSLCIHCNLCAASIFTGTRCALRTDNVTL